MRILMGFAIAFGVLTFSVDQAGATSMTQQQVKNVCGSGLQSSSSGGTSAMGCDKACGAGGKQMCTYNCCSGSKCGQQGCHGHVVSRTAAGGQAKLPLRPEMIRQIRASTPANRQTGAPAANTPRRTDVKPTATQRSLQAPPNAGLLGGGGAAVRRDGRRPNNVAPETKIELQQRR